MSLGLSDEARAKTYQIDIHHPELTVVVIEGIKIAIEGMHSK